MLSRSDSAILVPEVPDHLTAAHPEDCTDTECLVCMRLTIPQHIDSHGSKIEDMAGTGEYDALGG
jgi:hypothetical protein